MDCGCTQHLLGQLGLEQVLFLLYNGSPAEIKNKEAQKELPLFWELLRFNPNPYGCQRT